MSQRTRIMWPTLRAYQAVGHLIAQAPGRPGHWQLTSRLVLALPGWPLRAVEGADWRISEDGIAIEDTYTWDGASGPAIDCPAAVLASLVHDIVCERTPQGRAIASYWQRHRLYRVIALRQGMHPVRAWYHWLGLVLGNWAYDLLGRMRRKGDDSGNHVDPD